jgi:hypothetical protein
MTLSAMHHNISTTDTTMMTGEIRWARTAVMELNQSNTMITMDLTILTVGVSRVLSCDLHLLHKVDSTAHQDTDSDFDVYGQKYAPSADSLGGPSRMQADSGAPTYVDGFGGSGGHREHYPAWSADRQVPLSKEEIEDIFLDLTQKFGFQRDSMRNMVLSDPPDSADTLSDHSLCSSTSRCKYWTVGHHVCRQTKL